MFYDLGRWLDKTSSFVYAYLDFGKWALFHNFFGHFMD